jgi:hypothetical protein
MSAIQFFIDFDLISELRRTNLAVLEFESNFFAGFDVMACINQSLS